MESCSGDNVKIIYIEDDAGNRAVMQLMLATAGVVMTEAADARTGLGLIEEGEYDLVLMDLRMPEISGLTAIRQLRAREAGRRRMPIIVITADLTTGVQELCRAAGADDVIAKPVTMKRLFSAVGEALKGAETTMLN